jgi:very-short-patch-repair endonuclease
VPLSYWKYKWYAIELDHAHIGQREQDDLRNAEISFHGYEVVSLRPEAKGYYGEVKKLVERIEFDMAQAETDPWQVAFEVDSSIS